NLSLEEMQKKIDQKMKFVYDDVKALVGEVQNLSRDLDNKNRKSGDNVRDLAGLTADLRSLEADVSRFETLLTATQNQLEKTSTEITSLESGIATARTKLSGLETEKAALLSTLSSTNKELEGIEKVNSELRPKYETQVKGFNQRTSELTTERNLFSKRVEALRILCKKDYITSAEAALVKYLARKEPAAAVPLQEIRAATGLVNAKEYLKKLSKRNAIEFDESTETTRLLGKIDLY
ncbi:MAG TPA: hypothetical protein VJ044_00855, partial [Candidatus Hodarchaeales archaeon]|nr:hypothetical protein [Candidatus Hodarchaeales archaeon]